MNDVALYLTKLPAMAPEAIEKVRSVEAMALAKEQIPLRTIHTIHAGMYARTIHIPGGTMITGALIKIATTLIVTGRADAYIGDEILHLSGHNVIPGSAGRKQAFVAIGPVSMTMLFPTTAKTVDEAEREFTDEYELLASRRDPAFNETVITGE